MKRVFVWTGPVKPRGDVQKIGEALDRLHKEDGAVMPDRVVRVAADPQSPLHGEFEWDDARAAHHYRIDQARYVVQSVAVRIQRREGASSENLRAFVFLRSEARGYRDTVAVLNNESTRKQLIDDAMRDADIFRRKYSSLSELADVFSAIERTERRLREPEVVGA